MPRFSILIPTRNRCELLGNAIRSALAQNFDDIEIIVSDNNSSDGTQETIALFDDPRLRAIKTDKTLAMPYHWDWAIQHTRGEFVTVLCDDDALLPSLCERANTALRETESSLVYWRRMSYVYPNWQGEETKNAVRVRRSTGRIIPHRAKEALAQWYNTCAYLRHSPMVFNGFCRRRLIQDILDKAGSFFLPPSPDIGASLALLSHLDTYYELDMPLALAGVSPRSIGATSSTTRGEATQTFIREFDEEIHQHTPYKAMTITVAVAEVLLRGKRILPSALADYEVNWPAFWIGCYADLLRYRDNGVEMATDLIELERTIEQHRPGQTRAIRREAESRVATERRRKYLKNIRRRLPSSLRRNKGVIQGDYGGFSNIFECASRLEKLI